MAVPSPRSRAGWRQRLGLIVLGASVTAFVLLGGSSLLAQPDAGSADAGAAETAESHPEEISLRDLRASAPPVPIWQRLTSVIGLFAMVGIAWGLSEKRRIIPWRVIAWGIGLQLLFGIFVLKTSAGMWLFGWLNDVVVRLLDFTDEGARFLFGDYMDLKWSFALRVLPTIIFFSALMTVLYHFGILQFVVRGISKVMEKTMKTSGAETLSAAANIFLGQTEAPLVVKPYVESMTRSELMAVMIAGFASVAGGVLAAYVGMLRDRFPDIAGHLIAASVMSAPASLVIAKVMVPETETPKTAGGARLVVEKDANVVDAAARGAAEGLKLALNVAAMLLAFLALVALLNYLLGLPAEAYNAIVGREAMAPWTMQQILGYLFWPIAFLMGTPLEDCTQVASLLGEKTVLNEFVAFLHLGEALERGDPLQYRSVVIASYALCGFANFGSIAIQIGGIGGMAPSRRSDLAKLGFRAMFGGMLAGCMTACVAGILV